MSRWFFQIFLVIFAVAAANESRNHYENYKVYDITPNSQDDLNFLRDLNNIEGEERSLDFLSLHNNVGTVAQLAVAPEHQNYVENMFESRKIEYKVRTDDLQKKVDEEFEEQKRLAQMKSEVLKYDRYYRHAEINKYLDTLQNETYKDRQVTVKTVGKSYEGREIKTITITNGDGKKKNSIFIDAGIHAREWIAPATALYWIDQLVDPQSNYSNLLNEVDFVIMPVVNPDGYEYSHNVWRLWRKTRSINGFACIGVDSNRNYDFHWSEAGSSANSCAENHHGPKAFSEVETRISRDIMLELRESCKFFLSLHSYGHWLLYPWGYSNDLPENWKDQEEVAIAGKTAMNQATGVNYTVGSTSNTLYIASGSSIDYAYGEAKIPISIVMELAGGGWFGFDLPASEIEKNVKESAVGIAAMSEVVIRKFKNTK